jgi:hypothetical protein
VLTRRERLQRHEPQRRRSQLQVADEQLTPLVLAPFALHVQQLVVHHRPRSKAPARRLTGGISIDDCCLLRGRGRERIARRERHARVRGVLELVGPPQQRLPHSVRDHDAVPLRAEASPRSAPWGMQPLPAPRIAHRRKVELAKHRHEVVTVARPLGCDMPRSRRVLDPLRLVEPKALGVKIDAHAQEYHPCTRRLLLARLRAEAKAPERVDIRLPVKLGTAQLHATAHQRRASRIEEKVIDAHVRAIINVLRHGEEGRVRLLHLRRRGARREPGSTPLRQPG